MKNYAISHKILSQPRKSLISSFYGKDMLVITPLLKFYINKGLIMSNIKLVVEFVDFGNISRVSFFKCSANKLHVWRCYPRRQIWCTYSHSSHSTISITSMISMFRDESIFCCYIGFYSGKWLSRITAIFLLLLSTKPFYGKI